MAERPIPAYAGDGPYVFVCYAHEDKEIVYPEIRRLQDQGIDVWWDEGISPGSEWSDALANAIEGCSYFVYFITPRSVATENCRRELNHAIAETRQLLAVYLEETDVPGGIRLHLHNRQAILKHELELDSYSQQILSAIGPVSSASNVAREGTRAIDEPSNVVAGAIPRGPSPPKRLTRRISVLILAVAVAGAFAIWFIPDLPSHLSDTPLSETGSRGAGSTETDSIRAVLDKPMVAVLPFTNATGDPDNDFVGFGVMDEIIVGLQRFRSFPIVSRNSTIAFRHRTEPVHVIARELDAAYIVDGSLQLDRDGFRVFATMTNASGAQVWARRFDLDANMRGVFPMVDEVAATVAGAVRSTEIERVTSFKRPPINAWEHYVKGLAIVLDWKPARHEEGVEHIEHALEIAPNMAEAWWALGEFESSRIMTQPIADPATVEKVIGYFRKSHELNAFYGAACGCLGYWLAAVGRDREARVVFEQALEANPVSGALRVDYAQFLAWDGRYPEAIEMAEVGARLGIDAVDKSRAEAMQATAFFAIGQPDAALTAVNRSLLIKRIDTVTTPVAIAILFITGNHDAATVLFREFDEWFPDYSPTNVISQVVFKPIDTALARRGSEPAGSPESVDDIFWLLAATASNNNARPGPTD